MKERTLKIFAVVMSVLLFLSIVFGVLMYYTDWGRDWSKFTSVSEEMSADGGLIIGEESGSISLMSAVIPKEEYETNGVPANAEMAYIVTATVTPSNDATNTGVAWSGQWVNASSAWASGKALSDYVTVTPSGDGYMESKTAVIACLQAFGEPVTMTVTCIDAPDKTSSFRVDYARPILIQRCFIGNFPTDSWGGNTDVQIELNPTGTGQGGVIRLEFFSDDTYTLNVDYAYTVSLKNGAEYLYDFTGSGGAQLKVTYTREATLATGVVNTSSASTSGTPIFSESTSGSLQFDNAHLFGQYNFRQYYGGMGNYSWTDFTDLDVYSLSEIVFSETSFGQSRFPVKLWDLVITLESEYSSYEWSTALNLTGVTNTSSITGVSTDAGDGFVFAAD